MLKVNLDCDGVLTDFVQALVDAIKSNTGVSINMELLNSWKVQGQITQYTGLTKEYMDSLIQLPGFCNQIPWFNGGEYFIKRLLDLKDVDLHIVTSPYDSFLWMPERKASLMARGIPEKAITFTHKKEDVFAHVFIDDKVQNVLDWADSFSMKTPIIWKTPYTAKEIETRRKEIEDRNIQVFDDYNKLLDYIALVRDLMDNSLALTRFHKLLFV